MLINYIYFIFKFPEKLKAVIRETSNECRSLIVETLVETLKLIQVYGDVQNCRPAVIKRYLLVLNLRFQNFDFKSFSFIPFILLTVFRQNFLKASIAVQRKNQKSKSYSPIGCSRCQKYPFVLRMSLSLSSSIVSQRVSVS